MDVRLRLALAAATFGLACRGTTTAARARTEPPAAIARVEPPPAAQPTPAPSATPSAAAAPFAPAPPPSAAPPPISVSPPGSVVRLLRAGTPLSDGARALAADSAGDLFLAGKWGAEDSRGNEAFVAKVTPGDAIAWSAALHSDGAVSVGGIAVSKLGQVYVAGSYTRSLRVGDRRISGDSKSDIFLLKLGKAGQPVFLKRFSSAGFESARGIALDASGNIYLTGAYQGGLSFGGPALDNGGTHDVFVAKLDAHGRHVWSKRFSARGGTETTGMAVSLARNGSLYVAGRVQGGADFGGGPIRCSGESAAFVVRLSAAGKYLGARVFSGRGNASGTAVAADRDGAYVAGSFSDSLDFGDGTRRSRGGTDLFVLRLDKQLNVAWSKQLGDSKWGAATALALGGDGSVWLAGQFADSLEVEGQSIRGSGKDGLVLKLDRGGAAKAAWVLGGEEEDSAEALAAAGNRVFVAGTFAGTGEFAGRTLRSEGMHDIFLLELASDGPSAPAALPAEPPRPPPASEAAGLRAK
jgi:hypothetical protein